MIDPFHILAGIVLLAVLALPLRWPRRRDDAPARRGAGRYVYVIARLDRRGRAVGPTKIGIAKDPERRLRTFQTANPLPLTLYRTFRVARASALEADVHRRLGPLRLKGEWFALSPERAVSAVHMVLDRPRPGLRPAWHRLVLRLALRRSAAR